MNQINVIDISNDSIKSETSQNQQKKMVELKKNNEKEKRKMRFHNNTKIYQFCVEDKATGKVQFLEHQAKGQKDKREIALAKRIHYNNDRYEQKCRTNARKLCKYNTK